MRRLRKLHLGCGNALLPGYLNVDLSETFVGQSRPDLIADVRSLPMLETAAFDEIYASHVLEHVAWSDVEITLREWRRLLRPGGIVKICTPDLDAEVRRYLVDRAGAEAGAPHLGGVLAGRAPRTPGHRLASVLAGAPTDRPGAAHRVPWNYEFLREVLEDVGFAEVRRYTSDAPDWSTRWPDSLNVTAVAVAVPRSARLVPWEIESVDEIAPLRPRIVRRPHTVGAHLVFFPVSPDDPCLTLPLEAQVVVDRIDGSRSVAEICDDLAGHPSLDVSAELFLGLLAQRVITFTRSGHVDADDVFTLSGELQRAFADEALRPMGAMEGTRAWSLKTGVRILSEQVVGSPHAARAAVTLVKDGRSVELSGEEVPLLDALQRAGNAEEVVARAADLGLSCWEGERLVASLEVLWNKLHAAAMVQESKGSEPSNA